jgi:hypothetical protein
MGQGRMENLVEVGRETKECLEMLETGSNG